MSQHNESEIDSSPQHLHLLEPIHSFTETPFTISREDSVVHIGWIVEDEVAENEDRESEDGEDDDVG